MGCIKSNGGAGVTCCGTDGLRQGLTYTTSSSSSSVTLSGEIFASAGINCGSKTLPELTDCIMLQISLARALRLPRLNAICMRRAKSTAVYTPFGTSMSVENRIALAFDSGSTRHGTRLPDASRPTRNRTAAGFWCFTAYSNGLPSWFDLKRCTAASMSAFQICDKSFSSP